ncbi:Putative ATP-dependent RNA helicase DDX10 [Myotis davidii]|uniref:Putative ATP-dependent RNA helicase DDX10 n=1 Tax=Myotis davidii TaxID=225400 RepID=L5M2G2_MYODS|nr:Putative ATP-dependent RNA helicase DDX10 [Myotis davidii]
MAPSNQDQHQELAAGVSGAGTGSRWEHLAGPRRTGAKNFQQPPEAYPYDSDRHPTLVWLTCSTNPPRPMPTMFRALPPAAGTFHSLGHAVRPRVKSCPPVHASELHKTQTQSAPPPSSPTGRGAQHQVPWPGLRSLSPHMRAKDEEEAFLDWSDDDDDGFDPSTLPDPDKYRSSEESDSEETENNISDTKKKQGMRKRNNSEVENTGLTSRNRKKARWEVLEPLDTGLSLAEDEELVLHLLKSQS